MRSILWWGAGAVAATLVGVALQASAAGPACGAVYVKKRLSKSDGKETVERVPKYEVELVSPRPCGCADCVGERSLVWDPLGVLSFFRRW